MNQKTLAKRLVTEDILGGPDLGCFWRGGAALVKGSAGSLDGRAVVDRNAEGRRPRRRLRGKVDRGTLGRPQCRMRGWLLVENSTVEIFGTASLEVHSAFHPGPKPLETDAAGPVLYWLPGASALNRSTS